MTFFELFVSRSKQFRLPFLACIGLSVLFSSCQQTATVTQSAETATEAVGTTAFITPRKSPNDRRDYRYMTLDNQLKVLLVSDPETDKSAAAL